MNPYCAYCRNKIDIEKDRTHSAEGLVVHAHCGDEIIAKYMRGESVVLHRPEGAE